MGLGAPWAGCAWVLPGVLVKPEPKPRRFGDVRLGERFRHDGKDFIKTSVASCVFPDGKTGTVNAWCETVLMFACFSPLLEIS